MSDAINYMELWLLSCIFFVFAALLIYATILCQTRKPRTKVSQESLTVEERTKKLKDQNQRPYIDDVALILFPIAFAIFAAAFTLYKDKDISSSKNWNCN